MLAKTALDNYLQSVLDIHNIAGMSVAVTDQDGVIYANGFGVESVERPVLKSTPETLYKIASVSKVFNAVNAMCLLDQSLLDLDTPVKHYIPELGLCKLERFFLRGGVADNGNRIISQKHLGEMLARQVDRKDGDWHGLGIYHRSYGSHVCYGHTGWLSAYRTNMFVCPDKGCGVALMINTNRDKVRDEILATIFDMM